MEIIILFTALLTASFIIFPIIAYIKQKKLTRETGIQFLLLFLISIFYIAIGGAVIGGVIISSGNMGIWTMTIVIVVSVVVLILSCLYLLLGAIIPYFKKKKHAEHAEAKTTDHEANSQEKTKTTKVE